MGAELVSLPLPDGTTEETLSLAHLVQPEPLSKEADLGRRSRNVGAHCIEGVQADVSLDEQTVTLTLDEKTAAVLIYAATLMASQYEAHAREVRLVAEDMPFPSFGAMNRLKIALRHERIARRLRLVERGYRNAIDREQWGI